MEENQEIVKTPLTTAVILICIIAGSAGLMFGYDTAVIGGVMMMRPFLKRFFPSVLLRMRDVKQDQYCLFNSHKLTALVSSMFIAGSVSSLLAGRVTSVIGRKLSLVTSGILFLTGNALGVFAQNVDMLIVSRLFVGFGLGFANQAAPVYITEMAPTKWRGTLTTAFQFFICLGTVIATLINFAANNSGSDRGWRLTLGGGSVPAIILTTGAFFIPDTPPSLIQRGMQDEAQVTLTKVRSTRVEAEAELRDLISSTKAARLNNENPYVKLMELQYRPQLAMTIAIAGFQKLTGVGMVAFYAPIVMKTIGIGTAGSLLAAVVLGIVNLASVLVSAYMVDKIGRRLLFLQGGVQIIFSQVFIACTLALQSKCVIGTLPYNYGIVVLVLMCLISSAFGWSWGPLTWLVPSEILPIEVRAAGTGISVATNFVITFLLTQLSMAMLCSMKFGLFLFYGATTFFMTTFIGVFLPETKGVPLESMDEIWGKHWFWKWSAST
ncbi:sugar transport protein 5-like [Cynara cardunculus var. scolymus]|uniref:sugar transport protein 5-like n=1 Tax=Cynara cardunculus var. scolymus TaxID=59895 RepID=UPI000D626278|nr:sugar transport protein 5-like [Cynara cardunculus var. scolymus]